MSDPETSEIIALQSNLIRRLGEVGLRETTRGNLARQLAHVAVLGRSFAEHTLPLFLSMEAGHKGLLRKVVMAMKRNLDELRDATQDLEAGSRAHGRPRPFRPLQSGPAPRKDRFGARGQDGARCRAAGMDCCMHQCGRLQKA